MPAGETNKKDVIRERIRSLRRGFDSVWIEQASQLAAEKVLALPQFESARVVSCYMALPREVQTEDLIEMCWQWGKRVCVPALETTSRDYELAWLEAGEETAPGPDKIPQPKKIRRVQPKDVNLMIAPAMAFDRNGNRLGHGHGHYDRLMAKCPGYKIGLVFEVQIVDEVPVEAQDVSVDIVVTEQNLYLPASVRGGCG
jgi:5-formyltetrahydrofolate cyclo-ligase